MMINGNGKMKWLLGASTSIITLYGAFDVAATVIRPQLDLIIDQRVAIQFADYTAQVEKRIADVERLARDTNKDVDSLRNEQTILRTKIDNTERSADRTEGKIDRLLERLLPAPRR